MQVYLLPQRHRDRTADLLRYGLEIAAVASRTGATLVELGDVSDRFDDDGQRRIADIVGERSPPTSEVDPGG